MKDLPFRPLDDPERSARLHPGRPVCVCGPKLVRPTTPLCVYTLPGPICMASCMCSIISTQYQSCELPLRRASEHGEGAIASRQARPRRASRASICVFPVDTCQQLWRSGARADTCVYRVRCHIVHGGRRQWDRCSRPTAGEVYMYLCIYMYLYMCIYVYTCVPGALRESPHSAV